MPTTSRSSRTTPSTPRKSVPITASCAPNVAHFSRPGGRSQAATADVNFNTGIAASVDRAVRKVNWVDLWDTGVVVPRKVNLIYWMKRRGVDVVMRIKGVNAPHAF